MPAREVNDTVPVFETEAEKLAPSPPFEPAAGTLARRSDWSSTWYTKTSTTVPLGSPPPGTRFEADDSKAIQ